MTDISAHTLATERRNAAVLAYLAARAPGSVVLQRPDAVTDPYMGSGSHPDIVERVWKGLAGARGGNGRALVHGTPALVDAATGVILAAAIGTQYALRLRLADVEAAMAGGVPVTTRWSGGETFDVRATFGPDWVLGSWRREEVEWVAACIAELDAAG